jgi:hypothetical protein
MELNVSIIHFGLPAFALVVTSTQYEYGACIVERIIIIPQRFSHEHPHRPAATTKIYCGIFPYARRYQ